MITKISQSFIKDWKAYKEGEECGLLFREKYVNDKLFDDPEGSMALGSYFEFEAFGNLPKSNVQPKAVMQASGKDKLAEYRMADLNALRVKGNPQLGVKGLFEEMGLKIIHKGKRLTLGRFAGTIDLVVMVIKNRKFADGTKWRKGDKFVIDIKYSGLLSETASSYNKHGWKWSEIQKDYHGTQARQYSMLTGLPFYFMVFQSNNKQGTVSDIQLFRFPVTQEDVDIHVAEANNAFEEFQVRARADMFEPYPTLKRCQECPLKDTCKKKHLFPHPVTVRV